MNESKNEKAEHYNVKVPDGYKLGFDKHGTVTSLEAPKVEFDKYRETHIEWVERLGDSERTLRMDTYLTSAELRGVVRELAGGCS